jgi:hypothetical protein
MPRKVDKHPQDIREGSSWYDCDVEMQQQDVIDSLQDEIERSNQKKLVLPERVSEGRLQPFGEDTECTETQKALIQNMGGYMQVGSDAFSRGIRA